MAEMEHPEADRTRPPEHYEIRFNAEAFEEEGQFRDVGWFWLCKDDPQDWYGPFDTPVEATAAAWESAER